AFVIGLAAALKCSSGVAQYLQQSAGLSQAWLPVLAFVVVFLVVVFLVGLGAKALEGIARLALLGWLNKLGGAALFILLYLFIYSVILFYADSLHLVCNNTRATSVTYPFLKPLGPMVINILGVVFPFFKNMFYELTEFFDTLSKNTQT
ncbi:MAG: CvpA family protein, partial [Chitinophagaceae bacterium]